MKLQSTLRSPSGRTRPFALTSCPNCLETQIAPLASEYVGEGRVRHFWACDGCGHEFKTSIEFASR
jgi:hypothetical protein